MCWKASITLQSWKASQCQPLHSQLTSLQCDCTLCNMPLISFWGKCAEEPRAFSFSTLYRSNGNGCDDYMCKCTKSSTLQRDIIPKLQKSLKHAFNYFSLEGCWVRPLKKVAVFKISDCWWGFLGTVLTSTSLLHLPDHLRRHRGVEVDCVVSQALSGLVTLPTPTFEWFADADLRSVAILSVVLYAVHILWRRQKFPLRSHTCRTLAWTGPQ